MNEPIGRVGALRPARERRIARSPRGEPDSPLTWDEIDACDPRDFTLATMPRRFAELGDEGAYLGHDGTRQYMLDLNDAWEIVRADIDDLTGQRIGHVGLPSSGQSDPVAEMADVIDGQALNHGGRR